jgi:hypothetical protein
MSLFSRIGNGWDLTMLSLQTINRNKSLLLFPVISFVTLVLVLATFFGGGSYYFSDQLDNLFDQDNQYRQVILYAAFFLYYLISYFIIVFFNSALIYCASKTLNNEDTSVSDGLNFAASRVGKIFSWALVAASVGTILQAIQRSGKIGSWISSLLGLGWSILTFFVVPVLIFENRGVFDTIQQSGRMMREKWGESITSTVSFGLFYFIGVLVSITVFFLLLPVSAGLGLLLSLTIFLLVGTISSAAQTVFIAAVYNHLVGAPTGNFDAETLDGVFMEK